VLTGLAQTNNVTLRRRIAEALGDYAAPNVTNVLTQLLTDVDPNVRGTAAQALRRVQAARP
jgi:HEAT repeat protein